MTYGTQYATVSWWFSFNTQNSSYDIEAINMSVLSMYKGKHKAAKYFAQSHTASKWQNKNTNSGLLAPELYTALYNHT